ncbi:MAG: hypothetical protein A2075_19145 [Geobacteraceae bacterium GWC2_58_44]|nr:MAG: hypothetical protein A2075_19145 [Geobacteraceae bacterium GWC2_58_44]HBG05782.1 hypothetical protein [Geobacter sp.]
MIFRCTSLPLQGGGQEGDGVCLTQTLPHPHPDPPLEGEGELLVAEDCCQSGNFNGSGVGERVKREREDQVED